MSVVMKILIRLINVFTPLNPACSVPPSVLAYAMLNSGVSPHKQRTSTNLTNWILDSVVMALALAGLFEVCTCLPVIAGLSNKVLPGADYDLS
jgi:hypothetical protein